MARPDPSAIVDMMGPPEGGDSEAGSDSDMQAAVGDLVKALGIDPAKVDMEAAEEALKAFVDMC